MNHVLKVYKASAGSGKTFRLAVHYIKLLVENDGGGEYAHILAVTFTNKATTEMKDRIISQLYGIGHALPKSQAYYAELCKALEADGRTDLSEAEIRRRCREALHAILHDYNRFRVSTIDAFFQMILRGLAHELGLTANLQVEISDTEVLSEAVDRIVDRLQTDQVLLEWMYSLVRDQIENNQKWNVTGKVKSFGLAIFNEDYLFHGEALRQVLADEVRFNAILEEIKQLRDDAMAAVKGMAARLEHAVLSNGVDYTDFSNGKDLRSFAEKLRNGNMQVVVSERLRGWALDSESLVKKSDRMNRPDLVASARLVSDELEQVLEDYQRRRSDYNSASLVLSHIKSLRLLGAIDEEVAHLNTEMSRFILAKTPILLSRMIGESDAPFVFEKMGALLRHVMIDEFQDTSKLQWKNFRTLLLENYAKGGSNLIVGDVKQSIYRWRGGDWRVLGTIEGQPQLSADVESLNVNRRSCRTVIDFNSRFFERAYEALDNVSLEDATSLDEPFSFAMAYGDVKQECPEDAPETGYVRVTTLSTEHYPHREDWEPAIITDMMQQIRELHSLGIPYREMAILVRINKEAQPIINAFAEVEDMPAIVSDEAFLFASSPVICRLVAALRVMDDSDNQVATYYLRQLGAEDVVSDDSLRTKPLYELIETLYRRMHLDAVEGQDAFVFGFFDAVVDYTRHNASDIHSFLRYWDETLSAKSIPAGQVDGIRILTIHKAKGLEFHTVFLPFCTWAFERGRWSDLIWCHPTEKPFSELSLVPVTPTKAMDLSVFHDEYVREHLFSRLDELNSLYVGFTRACANLYIWSAGKESALAKPSRTVGDLIAALLPEGYTQGKPVLTIKAEGQSDNRMQPDSEAEQVSMCSYPLTATFRQSNRSQQFIKAQTDDLDELAMSEQARQQQYIETGKLLHSVLQKVRRRSDVPRVLDALEQDGVIARSAPDGTYVAVGRDELERWLDRGWQNPQVAEWFDGEWQIFNECSIVRTNPTSRLPETLRPDRVMIAPDGSRVVVVDFKFGRPHSDYDEQVETYMELLTAMYPEAVVEGYLWYVYSGKVQPVGTTPERKPAPQPKRAPKSSPTDSSQLTLDF